jgi:hypothetical protein
MQNPKAILAKRQNETPPKYQPIQCVVERVATRRQEAAYTVDKRLEVHANPTYRKDTVPS